jgi:hypothetical protein
MEFSEIATRFFGNLASRPDGIMALRFILQPLVSSALGIHDGIKDAKAGRSPYLWTILSVPHTRRAELGEGLRATAKVVGIAAILDVIYQFKALDNFYPGEAIVIALALGFVPYLLVRGPAARIAHWWMNRSRPNRAE